MELFATVQPLVFTQEVYEFMFGEDDPEEIAILQQQDREKAGKIESVLKDLFFLEVNLREPGSQEGDPVEIGDSESLDELRVIAAAVHGRKPDDYWEGNVPPGFQFNHLINHAAEDGYYLPVDFPQAFFVDDISVGSAVALLAELDALGPALAARFPDVVQAPPAAMSARGDGEIRGPVQVWLVLRELCRESIRDGLPVCFG